MYFTSSVSQTYKDMKVAKNEWSNGGVNSNGTCWSGSAYCYNAIYNVTTGKDIQTHVSNPTSCMNGFVLLGINYVG